MKKLITLCTVVRNEARYILEWIAYHRSIGIREFLIYDNESDDGTTELLERLSDAGVVRLISWPTKEGISPQVSAFEHARHTLFSSSQYVANLDADEFLFVAAGASLDALLLSLPSDVGAVAVNQRVVGSNGLRQYDPRLVLERFRKGSESAYDENHFFKTIYRPDSASSIEGPHHATLWKGRYIHFDGTTVERDGHPGRASHIDATSVVVNHYILKSWEEFLIKRARGGGAGTSEAARLGRYASDAFFIARDLHINATEIERLNNILPSVKDEFISLANLIVSPSSNSPDSAIMPQPAAIGMCSDPPPIKKLSKSPAMETEGIEVLSRRLVGAKTFLEYGAGGSTLLAASLGVPNIVSTESDRRYLEAVQTEVGQNYRESTLHSCYVDVGRTGEWGYPLEEGKRHQWRLYAVRPWEELRVRALEPDLVLIDGRFRIACFLASIIYARRGVTILFDDYVERSHYHFVEKYLAPAAVHGRMAEFLATGAIDTKAVLFDLVRYSVDAS